VVAHDGPNPRAEWHDIGCLVAGGLLCLGLAAVAIVYGGIALGALLPVAAFTAVVGLFLLGLAALAAAGVIRPRDR
jgi:hypothetical protein